jgi:hypothetical protein
MQQVHETVGFLIVVGWFALTAWGAVAWLRKREPGPWFWRILGVLQGILVLQLLLGLILWTTNPLPQFLHPFYGALFPLIVLVVAHVLARGMDDERERWKVFAVAAFFVFGLTLRALMTGLLKA